MIEALIRTKQSIGQQVILEGKGTAEIASNPLNWLGL